MGIFEEWEADMTDLIVMRLANMHRVHPRQDNSRVCAACGEQVGIYPSGQAMLAADPSIRLICDVCRTPADITFLAPGAEREPFESEDRR
jgi:hypothetical protein